MALEFHLRAERPDLQPTLGQSIWVVATLTNRSQGDLLVPLAHMHAPGWYQPPEWIRFVVGTGKEELVTRWGVAYDEGPEFVRLTRLSADRSISIPVDLSDFHEFKEPGVYTVRVVLSNPWSYLDGRYTEDGTVKLTREYWKGEVESSAIRLIIAKPTETENKLLSVLKDDGQFQYYGYKSWRLDMQLARRMAEEFADTRHAQDAKFFRASHGLSGYISRPPFEPNKRKLVERYIPALNDFIKDHPDSLYVDDVLLALAGCYYGLGEDSQAMQVLDKLKSDHPESGTAWLATEYQQLIRATQERK